MTAPALQISALLRDYESSRRTPEGVLRAAHATAVTLKEKHVWIHLLELQEVLSQLRVAQQRREAGEVLPLFAVPFAVKDNINVADLPTTAGCPSFAHTPKESATVVARLLQAGAVLLGKTNLDQFATGLVGTRSPYGACSSAFNQDYISGGSSSGSALAVAAGAVSFALGTDTAGSGRIPAGFNNIFGLKPTKGLISTHGVLPACKSLDCVSIFAGNADDAARILHSAAGPDPQDAFSRTAPGRPLQTASLHGLRVGVPKAAELEFFGDGGSERLFSEALNRLKTLGAQIVEFDFQPFREVANLLYSGAWVAERYAAVGEFLEGAPADAEPVVREIILGGKSYSAVDAFNASYRLQELRAKTALTWQHADILLVPTAGTAYTHEQIAEEPLKHNSDLGTYTNFVNLLDLSGIALPAGFKQDGLPFGVTLLGRAFEDQRLAAFAASLTEDNSRVGATPHAVSTEAAFIDGRREATRDPDAVLLAVVGAHLRGQPLHSQLTELHATFVQQTTTSANYELFALSDTTPPKPGLMRTLSGGHEIEVEVFLLSRSALGHFMTQVPGPLGIGSVQLVDGRWVKGFICEGVAKGGARNISEHGSWRRYLASLP